MYLLGHRSKCGAEGAIFVYPLVVCCDKGWSGTIPNMPMKTPVVLGKPIIPLWIFNSLAIPFVICLQWSAMGAMSIFIENHSFEDPVLADGTYTVNDIPGWNGAGSFFHAINPSDQHFTGTSEGSSAPSPIDGFNAAAVNNLARIFYQNLIETVQPNTTYNLTLLAGHRIGVPFGNASVNLMAGGDILVNSFPSPPEDTFIPVSLIYHSPSEGSVIGQPLRIELRSIGTSAQAWFDDVHLFAEEYAPVPEATTVWMAFLLCISLVANGIRFLRRQKIQKAPRL